MKNYYYTNNSSLVCLDTENPKNISILKNSYLNVDWKWVIREDGVFHYNEKEYEVKRGDIIFLLYPSNDRERIKGKREIVILNSLDILDNIEKMEAFEKENEAKACDNCPGCESNN